MELPRSEGANVHRTANPADTQPAGAAHAGAISTGEPMASKQRKPGLYANIHAKQERIKHGSGEHMRKPGEQGAPSAKDFEKAGKTAKKPNGKKISARKSR
jgi:hypothetical protein